MGKPVWWVRENIPANEFDDWIAYYSLYPFGPRQDDYRAGVIVEQLSLLVKAYGGRNHPREYWFRSLDPKLSGLTGDGGKAYRAWAMARCPAMGHVKVR